ncbi:MAG: sulfatase-like hydrolase/transferase [Kiritimatiellia bacterium]
MKKRIFINTLSDMGLCLAVAYVALLPQFYLVYEKGNRFSLDWSPTVRASILISIALLAAAYWMLYAGAKLLAIVADRWQRRVPGRAAIRAVAAWIMTAVAFRSAMAIVYATRPGADALARMIDSDLIKILCYAVLPAGLLICCRKRYEKTILGAYRVFGVMFALFVVQTFVWKHDAGGKAAANLRAAGSSTEGAGGLYILIFDEWGYDPTFGNPAFSLTHMPHLSALLEQATLFRDAYSPGIETWVSIPRFLFQTDERADDYSYHELREMLFSRSDFSHLKSIFDLSDRPYKFIGQSAINYASILGNRVDYIQPFYANYAQYFLKERVAGLLGSQLAFLRKAGLAIEARSVDRLSMEESWRQQQLRIRPVLNDVLPRLPSGTFAFIHMLQPHLPYGFARDGTPRAVPRMDDPDGTYYLDNVYATDAVIGDVVRILKERGEYDSSLIVITSDHGLRLAGGVWDELDAQAHAPEKHVPLIVKYPNQRRGAEVHATTGTAQLHPLFSDFLNDPDRVAEWTSRQDAGDGPAEPYGAE